ncbi:MAG: hemerythrin domain-containing protein [Actinomycetota bacterium]|nr:hemerythrin domain-containing protein [Actinomycetota bacterium]
MTSDHIADPDHEVPHAHSHRCRWSPGQASWVCLGSGPAESVTAEPLVDVRDMIVAHTAMLREFRLAPAAVTRTTPGDRRRASAVASHIRFLCDLLHHHHEGEDALLWPKLRERTSSDALGVIEEAEAQHHDLASALHRVEILRQAWADNPGGVQREELALQLETLHTLLRDHLDLEERALLPLAALVLTHAEWHAVGDAAVAAMPKSALPLAFGMFAYEGDPAVLTDMLAMAPPIPRKLLPLIAPRVYARRARRVHGSARP